MKENRIKWDGYHEKTNVGLVQINNSFDKQCYLPYTVGMLQAYAQKHLTNPDDFEFLIPIFDRSPVKNAADQLEGADVVAFSVYVWSMQLSLAIAKELKRRRPEILIVFGGPQVPERDAETFHRENPCVDLACHGEGEHIFLALLENLQDRNWGKVPSVTFLNDGGALVRTERCERISDIREVPSPFLEGVFALLMDAHPDIEWVGLWETNRGCPFSCAYCDWGSQTKNKVLARDIDVLYEETDWFSKNKVEFIFCTDANFSLLDRDLDIVTRVAQNKKQYGFPRALSVQSTKDFTETSYAMYQVLGEAELSKGVSLSLQSVHEPTLKAIHRRNIAPEVFREAQHRLSAMGIETFTDIILPLPEETYDSFVDGISEVMTNGQHNRIQFNNLSILPNALMGDPGYQINYDFTTVETDIVNIHGQLNLDNPLLEKQILVVGTSSMPPQDWVRTRVFSWMTSLLHFDKLLQIPFVLLHKLYGVSYRALLEAFMDVDAYPVLKEIYTFFQAKAEAIAKGDVEFCRSERWLNIWWPADELILIRLCTENRLEAFYNEAEQVLDRLLRNLGITEHSDLLTEALQLNRSLIKHPAQTSDLDIDLCYNLWEVYRGVLQGQTVALNRNGHQHHINRASQQWDSWEDWCRRVIWWGNKRGAYIYPCKSSPAGQPSIAEMPASTKIAPQEDSIDDDRYMYTMAPH